MGGTKTTVTSKRMQAVTDCEAAANADSTPPSYFSYNEVTGECELYTGVCTSGDSQSNFDTYDLAASNSASFQTGITGKYCSAGWQAVWGAASSTTPQTPGRTVLPLEDCKSACLASPTCAGITVGGGETNNCFLCGSFVLGSHGAWTSYPRLTADPMIVQRQVDALRAVGAPAGTPFANQIAWGQSGHYAPKLGCSLEYQPASSAHPSGRINVWWAAGEQDMVSASASAIANSKTVCNAPVAQTHLMYTAKYCATAAGETYGSEDLTTSGATTATTSTSINKCKEYCIATATCSYFSFTNSNSAECLLYSACDGGKLSGFADTLTYAITSSGALDGCDVLLSPGTSTTPALTPLSSAFFSYGLFPPLVSLLSVMYAHRQLTGLLRCHCGRLQKCRMQLSNQQCTKSHSRQRNQRAGRWIL